MPVNFLFTEQKETSYNDLLMFLFDLQTSKVEPAGESATH